MPLIPNNSSFRSGALASFSSRWAALDLLDNRPRSSHRIRLRGLNFLVIGVGSEPTLSPFWAGKQHQRVPLPASSLRLPSPLSARTFLSVQSKMWRPRPVAEQQTERCYRPTGVLPIHSFSFISFSLVVSERADCPKPAFSELFFLKKNVAQFKKKLKQEQKPYFYLTHQK